MTKPNKDGWIRHRGGTCPVEVGVCVDVMHRDGVIYEKVEAGIMAAEDWTHSNSCGDIFAYRIHQPAHMTAEQIRTQFIESLAAIAALHKDQAALVQLLRELGFAFVDAASETEEDMSDPKNWRVGDLVEVLDDCTFCAPEVKIGDVYPIREIDSIDSMCIEPGGTYGTWSQFKFHSRPTTK